MPGRELLLAGFVPVTGAVHGELADLAVADVCPQHFPAIPMLAVVCPALFELEHEAVRGRVEASVGDLAWPGVTVFTYPDELF